MRCTGITKKGKQCRWPATKIAGGLGVCEFHVNQAWRLFHKVNKNNQANPDWEKIKQAALNDSGQIA